MYIHIYIYIYIHTHARFSGSGCPSIRRSSRSKIDSLGTHPLQRCQLASCPREKQENACSNRVGCSGCSFASFRGEEEEEEEKGEKARDIAREITITGGLCSERNRRSNGSSRLSDGIYRTRVATRRSSHISRAFQFSPFNICVGDPVRGEQRS